MVSLILISFTSQFDIISFCRDRAHKKKSQRPLTGLCHWNVSRQIWILIFLQIKILYSSLVNSSVMNKAWSTLQALDYLDSCHWQPRNYVKVYSQSKTYFHAFIDCKLSTCTKGPIKKRFDDTKNSLKGCKCTKSMFTWKWLTIAKPHQRPNKSYT